MCLDEGFLGGVGWCFALVLAYLERLAQLLKSSFSHFPLEQLFAYQFSCTTALNAVVLLLLWSTLRGLSGVWMISVALCSFSLVISSLSSPLCCCAHSVSFGYHSCSF